MFDDWKFDMFFFEFDFELDDWHFWIFWLENRFPKHIYQMISHGGNLHNGIWIFMKGGFFHLIP